VRIVEGPARCFISTNTTEERNAGAGDPDGSVLRLKFRPNPAISRLLTRSRFWAAWMDSCKYLSHRRIVRIDGTLFKEVAFGWGILGPSIRGGPLLG